MDVHRRSGSAPTDSLRRLGRQARRHCASILGGFRSLQRRHRRAELPRVRRAALGRRSRRPAHDLRRDPERDRHPVRRAGHCARLHLGRIEQDGRFRCVRLHWLPRSSLLREGRLHCDSGYCKPALRSTLRPRTEPGLLAIVDRQGSIDDPGGWCRHARNCEVLRDRSGAVAAADHQCCPRVHGSNPTPHCGNLVGRRVSCTPRHVRRGTCAPRPANWVRPGARQPCSS